MKTPPIPIGTILDAVLVGDGRTMQALVAWEGKWMPTNGVYRVTLDIDPDQLPAAMHEASDA